MFILALTTLLGVHGGNEDYWYIIPVILGDFALRTVFGPVPLSPFGVIATSVLWVLRVPPDFVPSSAKRFSFFLGIVLNTVLCTLHFGLDASIKVHAPARSAGDRAAC